MVLTHYGFNVCVGGFFQMSTTDARNLLPAHLEPLEAMHTRSVLAVLAFQFTESEVGAYDELVMAIITPPRVTPGKPLPKAAFFPFMVATSTAAARAHAIERWRLPHYMADVDFAFEKSDGTMEVTVSEDGAPIVELKVTDHDFNPAVNQYHSFTIDGDDRFKVNIFMDALHSEHDEEAGGLVLHPHPMTAGLTLDEVSSYPMREEWYQAGLQTFEEMESI